MKKIGPTVAGLTIVVVAGWILLQEKKELGSTLNAPTVAPNHSGGQSPSSAQAGSLGRTAIADTLAPDLSRGRIQVRGADGDHLPSPKFYLLPPFLGGAVPQSYAQMSQQRKSGNEQGLIQIDLENLQAQTVVVWAAGYVPQRAVVKPGGDQSIQLIQSCLCSIEVTEENGVSIPHFQFRWTDPKHRLDGFPLVGVASKEKPALVAVPREKELQLEVFVAGVGYQKKQLTLNGLQKKVTISLTPRSGSKVQVLDGYGVAVAEAQARFQISQSSAPWRVTSNQQGFLLLAGIPVGEWQVSLSAEGHISQEFTWAFSESGSASGSWILPRAGTLQVNLVNAHGEHLPGVTLRMMGVDRSAPVLATTNENGTAMFSALGPGAWTLQANGPNGGGGSPPLFIDMEEGANEVVSMELENWRNLTVRIFHQGSPAVGATGVLLLPPPWSRRLMSFAASNSAGLLVFPAIPDVAVGAEFRLHKWALSATERLEKIPSGEISVTLPDGTVKGSWVSNGEGIGGVTVVVDRGRGSPVELGQSDAEGAFVVACVAPGRYRFRPQHPQWVSVEEPLWQNHRGGELLLEPQELTRAGNIIGLVDSPLLQQPFFLVHVRLIGSEGREWGKELVSDGGAFSFSRIPLGDYQLVFQQGNQILAEKRLELSGVRSFSRIQIPD